MADRKPDTHADYPTLAELRRALTLRFAILFLAFLALSCGTYFAVSGAVAAKEYDSVVLNLAGRQRTLSQKYAREVNQAIVGLAISDPVLAADMKAASERTAALYETTLQAFLEGGEVDGGEQGDIAIPRAQGEPLMTHLRHVERVWSELRSTAAEAMEADPASLAECDCAQRITELTAHTIADMDHAVMLMQRQSEAKLRRVRTHTVGACVLSVVLLIAAALLVRAKIIGPLIRSMAALSDSNERLTDEIAQRTSAEQQIVRETHVQTALNELLSLSVRAQSEVELASGAMDILLAVDFLRIEDKGAFFLANEQGGELILTAHRNLSLPLHSLCAKVPFGHCLCGRAAESRETQFASCVDHRHDISFQGMGSHGHYNVPLRNGDQTLGVIALYLPCGSKRNDHEVDFLETAADILAGAVLRISAERKLRANNAEIANALERERYTLMELEAAMEQLEAAKLEAEAASQAKSEFLANMSHEIRTPMTAILGYAETLIEEGDIDKAPPERIAAINTIQRNGDHLLQIINDILDISKIEAGKLEVERIRCSPVQVVADVRSLMQVRADAKNLPFRTEFVGSIPETIESDPTRLKQILVNLIGNALKFTETGGVRLIARFVQSDDKASMQFDVIDTGVGMGEDAVKAIFRAFTQADASTTRKFGGTGLGLSISRRLAEMLGGDITVESKLGEGSLFRLTVDAGSIAGVKMVDDPARAAIAENEEGPVQAESGGLDFRVLLAEDGPDNQRLISFMLRKAGADVTIVENGQLALEAAETARAADQPFDVILMDMQMPVMDGYQTTRRLRRNGYTAPIVALTAHAMSGDRQKCINAGCDDYATKPINRVALIDTVRTHAQRARATLQV